MGEPTPALRIPTAKWARLTPSLPQNFGAILLTLETKKENEKRKKKRPTGLEFRALLYAGNCNTGQPRNDLPNYGVETSSI